VDDWKLVGRSEDDLENEIKIVKAISKDNMNFGLEKCATICLEKGKAQNILYTGRTFKKNVK